MIMVRASTEKQSVEDQHNEMAEFCRAEGYADEDMVWIEDKGASAAKVNEKYRQMIEDVKLAINCKKPVEFLGKLGGYVVSPEEICEKVMEVLK